MRPFGPSWRHLSPSQWQPGGETSKTRNYRSRVLSHVADIAEIDKDKKILAQIAKKKKRAGAGRPPQGSQSGARPLWAGQRRVRRRLKILPRPMQSKFLSYICLKSLAGVSSRPPVIPPGALRIPSGSAKNCILPGLFSLQISISFLISIFDAILSVLEPKLASKTDRKTIKIESKSRARCLVIFISFLDHFLMASYLQF